MRCLRQPSSTMDVVSQSLSQAAHASPVVGGPNDTQNSSECGSPDDCAGNCSEAMAQTPPAQRAPSAEPAAPKAPVAGQILVQDANTVLAKQELIGQTVYAPDKAKIGSISDLHPQQGRQDRRRLRDRRRRLPRHRREERGAEDGSAQDDVRRGGRHAARHGRDQGGATNAPSFKSKRDQDAEKAAEQRRSEQPPAQRPMPGTK